MWYPDAIVKKVARYQPGGSSHTPMTPKRVCLHTAVSSGTSLFALFNIPGNAVAHFYVREDGKVEQYVSTGARASANLDGNHDIISIESWDAGGKRETWTNAQVRGIAKLLAWVNKVHGIPLRQLDDSKTGRTGVGWHRMGIDGNFPTAPGTLLGGRVAGGEHWSKSFGKECPFSGKIRGTVNDILPMARNLAKGNSDDMPTIQELMQHKLGDDLTVAEALKAAESNQREIAKIKKALAEFRTNEFARDKETNEKLDAILSKVS